ncbi:Cap15 family cyclic dinucleotide receptor domain-containing protein [Streptomyces gibsoniae]|uniref:CD-NTase-associated protein 15 domain-containing protein n=1 Tax=Streptomyces gibsoniae TaxID=3075529 RepID=A0ABU2U538_9ACTN|nr:hypothetical protein [Streptomyces sp. DSM 41699]MDT0468344.1 hypothetical protein [Streptomyces sp. DSM 41699]
MMSTAQSIRWGATAASTVYGVLLYLLGLHPDKELKYALAYVPSLLGYLVVIFDKWAWRWPGIHRLTGHPKLGGTWRTTLSPSSASHIPAGGNRGPIRAYLTIEQSYWTLHATLRTAESSSRSTNAAIEKTDGSGIAELRFLYENTPQAAYQQRSPRHTGACRLSVSGSAPQAMTGRYYTDRFTAGDMDLVLVSEATDHATYEQARTADTAP